MLSYIEGIESSAETVDIPGIDSAYIVTNRTLERILFDRMLTGLNFTQACEDATFAFLSHFVPEVSALGDDIAELMLLTKGLFARLRDAFARVFSRNLELNLLATKRTSVIGDQARISVQYTDFSAPAKNLIIADLVASGATICTALARFMEAYPLEQVFVFSSAGTVCGGKAIGEFCRSHGVRLHFAYGLAAFGLGENGFDLLFLHPDTITSEKYRRRAAEVFGDSGVSAVGWDFGSQAQSVRKYKNLCWLESRYVELQDSSFLPVEPPTDIRLIEKEHAAFRTRYPSLSDVPLGQSEDFPFGQASPG